VNINMTILEEISSYLHYYDCHRNDMQCFLTYLGPFAGRQNKAIQIIEGIMTAHGKKKLLHYVAELARVEYGIRELEPCARDHVVHGLLSFILGIYLNEKFLKPMGAESVNTLQWELAGLFHDVGYPAQVAKDAILEPFTAKINQIARDLGVRDSDVYFKIVPVGLESLTRGVNSLDLIQDRLDDWGLRISAREEYDSMIDSGETCHGIISSLAVLRVIDCLYRKYNRRREYIDCYAPPSMDPGRIISFNQKYFERDIVSACTAIYIHNLPNKCFVNTKIDRSKAPVAFLLKLSDCLQEWERPSFEDPTGLSATQFDIKIDDGELVIQADILDDRKKKIESNLSSTLIAPDIHIR
jgi:hypothetical protein